MTWLREAFEWVQDRCNEARSAQMVLTHGQHSKKHTVIWPSGEYTTIDRVRAPKVQHVKTINSFAEACRLASVLPGMSMPVIYVTLGKISARPSEMSELDNPDDRINFDFEVHPLVNLAKGISPTHGCVMTHAELRLMLTARFGEVTFSPSNLLDLIRTVQFSALSETESDQARDLEKLGKRLTARVTGIEALPEKFSASFHATSLFPAIGNQEIAFDLTPIPSEQKFRLTPVAGSVVHAVALIEDDLVDQVQNEVIAAGVQPAAVLAGYRD